MAGTGAQPYLFARVHRIKVQLSVGPPLLVSHSVLPPDTSMVCFDPRRGAYALNWEISYGMARERKLILSLDMVTHFLHPRWTCL